MRSFVLHWLLLLAMTSYAEELRLGFTGPLSGPSAKLGEELVQGIELGFTRINESHQLPYQLRLVTKDDGYEPKHTPVLIRQMIDQNNIVGLISSVGTPTIISAIPTLQQFQIPLISPISGSSALKQDTISSLIFTQRASYHDEAKLLAKTVVEQFGIAPNDMAVYIQKDSYGEGTLRSLTEALKPYGLNNSNDILKLYYTRNHPSAEEAVAKILAQAKQPKAIFLISTYPAATELITLMSQVGVMPLFVTFSFVSHDTLIKQIRHTEAQILSSLVRPCMDQNRYPMVKEFFEDVMRYGSVKTATPVELEGYLAARYVEAALLHQASDSAPNRAEFLALLSQYEKSRQAQVTSQPMNDASERAQFPIWLELQDLKKQHRDCSSALSPEFQRGSL